MLRRASGLAVLCVLGTVVGCQTLGRPVTETDVDEELLVKPTPASTPAEDLDDKPRSGFHQESPGAQQP